MNGQFVLRVYLSLELEACCVRSPLLHQVSLGVPPHPELLNLACFLVPENNFLINAKVKVSVIGLYQSFAGSLRRSGRLSLHGPQA